MKGLYVTNIDTQKSVGYIPKLSGQLSGFRRLGIEMELLYLGPDYRPTLMKIEEPHQHSRMDAIGQQNNKNIFLRRVSLLKAAFSYISLESPSFLYFRYPRSEPIYIYFLRKIRQAFPKLVILSEFPTFPYDKEYKGVVSKKEKLVFWLDRLTRNYQKQFIDRAIAVNYNQPIFGIDTISIDNGIDVSGYRKIVKRAPIKPIKLIGVANVNEWHGYDRIIRGLGQYYRKKDHSLQKIEFHIVGAKSPFIESLRTIAVSENVAQTVTFYPPTQGHELDALFEECCLAIGVLGGHRKQMNVMSPLKNREYCARGIPFVFSHIDPDFSSEFDYSFQVEAGEKAVDIESLVDFITSLNKQGITFNMRNYAEANLDWSIKLAPVKAYLSAHNSSLADC